MGDPRYPVKLFSEGALVSSGITRMIAAPFSGKVSAVKVSDTGTLAASDADFVTVTLTNKSDDATGTTTMAQSTTRAQGLNALAGYIAESCKLSCPAIPTTALATGINPGFTAGAHLVKVAYVTKDGGVGPLSESGVSRTTDSSDAKITVSIVASTNPNVGWVNIYATLADATDVFYLVSEHVANTTTTVNVGKTDAALVLCEVAPTTATAAMTEDTYFDAGDVLLLDVAFAASGAFTNGQVEVFADRGR